MHTKPSIENKVFELKEKKMKHIKEKGFTLIELIIVMVIIGILTAVIVPRFLDLSEAANTSACKQNQGSIEAAANIGYANNALSGNAAYPADIATMVSDGLLDEQPLCPTSDANYEGGYDNADGTVTCPHVAAHNS
jgi:prepilin-type N-terminal cleavage/methylation domain-containing protein